MKSDDVPANPSPEAGSPSVAQVERPIAPRRRRAYAPPAVESGGGFTLITLGTKAPVLPGQGC
jgi:hypothetical protein